MSDRIAIVAPGGIGGPLGGLLALGGEDVTLIDQWPAHVEAVRASGLRVTVGRREDPEAVHRVSVPAHHVHEVCLLREPFDVVFLCSKVYDSRWLAELVVPRLAPDGVLVTVQNSLAYEWVAPVVGLDRLMCCRLTGGGELLEPGHVWRNRGLDHPYYTLGEPGGRSTTRLERIRALLAIAGRTSTVAGIEAALWTKLIHNSVSAALSGLVSSDARSWDLLDEPGYVEASTALYREGIAVAAAHDVSPESLFGVPADTLRTASPDAVERLLRSTGGGASPGARSMVQQDLLRGRPTEVIGFFNGLLVSKGRIAGVAPPAHDRVVSLYRRLETGALPQGPENLLALTDRLTNRREVTYDNGR